MFLLLAACFYPLEAQEAPYLPLYDFEKVATFDREEIRAISKSPVKPVTLIGTRIGLVWELDGDNLVQPPLLDISSKVQPSNVASSIRGLIDVVPSPNPEENALIISYTSVEGEYLLRVSKFDLPAGEETVLLDVPFGSGSNSIRFSGDLAVGPDGLLYIGIGDGSHEEMAHSSVHSQDLSSAAQPGVSITYRLINEMAEAAFSDYGAPFPIGKANAVYAEASFEDYVPVGHWFDVTFRDPIMASLERIAGGGRVVPGNDPIGALTALMEAPMELALGPDGTVFVLGRYRQDTGLQDLYTIHPDGRLTGRRFVGEPSAFTDIAVRKTGQIVLAAPDYPGLAFFFPQRDGDENDLTYVGIAGAFPEHICAGPDDAIYVTDQSRLRRVRADGIVDTIGGSGFTPLEDEPLPAADIRFISPGPVACGVDGTLWVADRPRLLRLDANGMIRPLAGHPTREDHRDGNGVEALLNRAYSITSDANGYVYIPNIVISQRFGEGSTIRLISPRGDVSTIYPVPTSPSNANPLEMILGITVYPSGLLICADDAVYRLRLRDSDFDFVPDNEELFPLAIGRQDLDFDQDADGYADAIEQLFQSDPLDASSTPPIPEVIALKRGDGGPSGFAVHLPTEPFKMYRLEGSDDLVTWRPLETFRSSDFASTVRIIYTEPWRTARYFRGIQVGR